MGNKELCVTSRHLTLPRPLHHVVWTPPIPSSVTCHLWTTANISVVQMFAYTSDAHISFLSKHVVRLMPLPPRVLLDIVILIGFWSCACTYPVCLGHSEEQRSGKSEDDFHSRNIHWTGRHCDVIGRCSLLKLETVAHLGLLWMIITFFMSHGQHEMYVGHMRLSVCLRPHAHANAWTQI